MFVVGGPPNIGLRFAVEPEPGRCATKNRLIMNIGVSGDRNKTSGRNHRPCKCVGRCSGGIADFETCTHTIACEARWASVTTNAGKRPW
jgi:hypothetical protein